jgi:nicotinate-nucleotide pyrophosphorylase (carboxylating)
MASNQVDSVKIQNWIKEDLGNGDITSNALIPENSLAEARIYLRENHAVVSGLTEVAAIFDVVGCKVEQHVKDGGIVEKGEIVLTAVGKAQNILAVERTVLNIFQRMSSIATLTKHIVDEVSGVNPSLRIAATRKTVPGLRVEDKKAVVHGGGDPHRYRLDDCVLIKDNHLRLVSSISEAVARVRDSLSFTKKIEVEVQNHEQALEAVKAGVEIIMYDNMNPREIKSSLSSLTSAGLRLGRLFEASGGVNRENIKEYASTGVDIISLGFLTHSVQGLDVKLDLELII